jgi:replicative DNA helicase
MLFTLEMTVEQVAARINASFSGVSSGLMLYKKLRTDQIRDFERAKSVSDGLPIYVDDSSRSYDRIKGGIRFNAIRRGVKVFYIDFLQRISKPASMRESEAQFYETLSNDFKDLAKDLKVCIVALSQFNREVKDADPRPTLSKFKASSGIEQAADTALLLYRPGYYGKRHRQRPELDPERSAEIIIGKGRNIGTGSFYVGFSPELSQFNDIEAPDDAQSPIPVPAEKELPF